MEGMSGFLFAALIILGIMYIIPVKTQFHVQSDVYVTESLFASCRNGFRELLRTGHGSFALRAFGFLIFMASCVFVYVAGKWALIFLSKIKERWE